MRLIDADELMKTLMHEGLGYQYNRVMSAPTVDAVPVVRCKDCKFSMSGINKYNERYILCQLHERSYGVIDDGFCKWAERKEE